MHVTGTAGTKEGLDLVRSAGADVVYNHRDKGYMKELQKGELFDVILEMLANVNLGHDLQLMRSRGRTIVSITKRPCDLEEKFFTWPLS